MSKVSKFSASVSSNRTSGVENGGTVPAGIVTSISVAPPWSKATSVPIVAASDPLVATSCTLTVMSWSKPVEKSGPRLSEKSAGSPSVVLEPTPTEIVGSNGASE